MESKLEESESEMETELKPKSCLVLSLIRIQWMNAMQLQIGNDIL